MKRKINSSHREKTIQGESRMKTVAYLRVSKENVNNQRLAILQFAQRERGRGKESR